MFAVYSKLVSVRAGFIFNSEHKMTIGGFSSKELFSSGFV